MPRITRSQVTLLFDKKWNSTEQLNLRFLYSSFSIFPFFCPFPPFFHFPFFPLAPKRLFISIQNGPKKQTPEKQYG